jgi:hypothetical protein
LIGAAIGAVFLGACALIVGDPHGRLAAQTDGSGVEPPDASADVEVAVPDATIGVTDAGATEAAACGPDGAGCTPPPCVTSAFPYTPSSFDPARYAAPDAATTDCNGTYSSTSHAFTTGGCAGQLPQVVSSAAQTVAGHAVDLLVFKDLTIAAASTLTLVGNNPVILAVYGDAQILGTVEASANGTTPGPGGNECPATSNGADAGGGAWETGGGGGGQAAAGGAGGSSRDAGGETPGQAQGTGPVPLAGGCAGGLPAVEALGFSPTAGAGGGAVQISAAGTLDFSAGTIKANGSNGGPGEPGECASLYPAQNGTGGAGGGSGGTVILEGAAVVMGAAKATGGTGGAGGAAPSPNSQAGGAGGPGGAAGAMGSTGSNGTKKGSAPPSCSWGGYWSGGGGGGGGGGYLKISAAGTPCCSDDAGCLTTDP